MQKRLISGNSLKKKTKKEKTPQATADLDGTKTHRLFWVSRSIPEPPFNHLFFFSKSNIVMFFLEAEDKKKSLPKKLNLTYLVKPLPFQRLGGYHGVARVHTGRCRAHHKQHKTPIHPRRTMYHFSRLTRTKTTPRLYPDWFYKRSPPCLPCFLSARVATMVFHKASILL